MSEPLERREKLMSEIVATLLFLQHPWTDYNSPEVNFIGDTKSKILCAAMLS